MATVHDSHSRSGSNLSYHSYRQDGYTMEQNGGTIQEATQVVDLLRRQIAYLSGGRDRKGGPIITFPSHNIGEEFTPKDIADCITYLASIPSEESTSQGLTVIVDNRQNYWKNLRYLLKTIWQGLENKLGVVFVVQGSKQGRLSSFRKDKYEVPIEPQMVTLQKLHQYVSPTQLTYELGGSLNYKHDVWLANRLEYERFLREAKSVSTHLDSQMSQINELWKQEASLSPNDLFHQREYLQEHVLQSPENIIRQGRELYRKFQVDADSGFSQSNVTLNDGNYTLDQVIAMNSIKRSVEHLENKLDKITELWQDQERSAGQNMQLSELELAMKTVVDWILGPAEKLLISQNSIGNNYSEAEELRKQHEQLELKCTDTYGTYAELRHKAEELLAEGHKKSDDVEAQRDYMDTVCRSYAARLEKRRNLIITSVRYHRLGEELSRILEDLFNLVHSDVDSHDVAAAQEALTTLTDQCEAADTAAEQMFSESHNLLDQLSLPIKNACGKDITPNVQSQVDQVEQMTAGIRERKGQTDELSGVRRLKLQQILQLRTCERDAEQATAWILKLCQAAMQSADQANVNPELAENDRKKLQSTAKSTYEYGKQLLQASLVLRRSLHYDLDRQKELLQNLNEAWKKFSQGDSEVASRVNNLALFNRQANEVLDSINRVMVAVSQVFNQELPIPDLILQHTEARDKSIDDYNATVRQGQELLQRLAVPVLTKEGVENRPGDRAAMETVQNKMDLMQQRIQKMDHSWLDATKGLYLDAQGQIRGPDGRLHATSPEPPPPPLPERRSRSRPSASKVTHTGGIVQGQATVTMAAAPPVRQFAQPLGAGVSDSSQNRQLDPWQDMEQKLQQVRMLISVRIFQFFSIF